MKYTLKQLEVFLATAQKQNITQAADALAMSQSAASSALKELEQQFDTQLFDRIGKRLKLSEHGRHIRPLAQSLLEQAHELESHLAGKTETGELKVGATLSIGNYLAVELIAEMLDQQQDLKVDLQVANTSKIAERVLNFDLDIGLVEGEVSHPQLEIIPWRSDKLVVFTTVSHPLAQKQAKQKSLSTEDLLDQPWILRESGSGTRQGFDRVMHDVLSELNIRFELQHTEAIKRAVESNLGIGCLSEITLQEAFKRKSLVPLEITDRNFSRQLYFVLHKDKYHSLALKRWMELCNDFNV